MSKAGRPKLSTGIRKITLTKTKTRELADRRANWKYHSINQMLAFAYDDWIEVTGSTDGFANYQTHILDSANLLHTSLSVESVSSTQKILDASIIQDFFKHIPEDTVMGVLTQDLVDSILKGKPVRYYASGESVDD